MRKSGQESCPHDRRRNNVGIACECHVHAAHWIEQLVAVMRTPATTGLQRILSPLLAATG